ncbi:Modification methylase DpnIIA [Thalassocella blandensis]|nr:Modification methylase DpnIIA [Thalassocella blandensis]
MPSKPLIRWAGSKRKLLPTLLDRIPSKFNAYIEPFCGSACLFFELAPANAILGDINQELINALTQIKRQKDIYDELVRIPDTPEEYYKIRQLDPARLNVRMRAIRFLYLNRYCFNGVYRTNMEGKFNVPKGTKTGCFPSKEVFDNSRKLLRSAHLIVASYENTLKSASKGDFAYIDPPYAKSGKFTGEYGPNSFDSRSLPKFVNKLNYLDRKQVKFLFSYRACQEVLDLLPSNYKVSFISVKRHIAGFKSGWNNADEILVQNY